MPTFRPLLVRAAVPATLAALAWAAATLLPLTANAFWPVAAAGLVLQEQAVRFADDPISPLPVEGGRWVVQPWLAAVAMRGAWVAGGEGGLVLLGGVLSVASTLALYLVARRHAGALAAALATVVVSVLLMPALLRTEQFAVLAFAVLVAVCATRAWWWAAPLAIAVWTNVHGSAPIGAAWVVAVALGMSADGGPQAPWWRRGAWVVACVAAVVAHPLGPGVLGYIRDVGGTSALDAITPLWRPLELLSWRGGVAVGVLAAAAAGAWRLGGRRRGLWLLAPVVVLAALAVDAQRHLAWLAVATLPLVAAALGGRIRRELTSVPIAGALALLCVVLVGVSVVRHDEFALAGMPVSQLERRDVDGDDLVFASAEWADYVYLETGAQVVVDARLERYRERDLDAYVAAIGGDVDAACGFGADHFLLRKETAGALERALDGRGPCRG